MSLCPYIAFEGPIAAGKTTLATLLAAHISSALILEDFEQNEFLADFYSNRDRWSLPMQLWFLSAMAAIDEDLGAECVEAALPALQAGFGADPLQSFVDINRIRWSVLGQHPFGDTKPNRSQVRLSKAITDTINPARVCAGICNCRYGDWEEYAKLLFWLRQVNSEKHLAIVASVDWTCLSTRANGLWSKPPREFRLLLNGLVTANEQNPVRRWIAEHADKISEIDPILSSVSPEAAVAVLRRGGSLNLAGHNGLDWKTQAVALWKIGMIERDLAVAALEADKKRIAQRVAQLTIADCEELPLFFEFLEEFSPSFLAELFALVDVSVASSNWPLPLANHRKQVRDGARQIFRFAQRSASGELTALAIKLSRSRPRHERYT